MYDLVIEYVQFIFFYITQTFEVVTPESNNTFLYLCHFIAGHEKPHMFISPLNMNAKKKKSDNSS